MTSSASFFFLFFAFLFLSPVTAQGSSCQLVDLPQGNECLAAGVGGPLQQLYLPNDTNQSEMFDDTIAFDVSSARLTSPFCRRGYLWFICNLQFPQCVEDGGGKEEACDMTFALCEEVQAGCLVFGVNLDCNQYPKTSSSSSSCNLTTSLSGAQSHPINVTTCLSSNDTAIPYSDCCLSPFLKDPSSGECVPECFLTQFPVETEDIWYTVMIVFTFFSCLFLVITALPVCLATDWLIFPNYLQLLVLVHVCVLYIVMTWSVFAGGRDEYVCNGAISYFEGVSEFLGSARCKVQLFLVTYIAFGICWWSFALSGSLCAQLLRHQIPMFSFFTVEEMTLHKQKILHLVGFCSAILFSSLTVGLENHKLDDGFPKDFHKSDLDHLFYPVARFCIPIGSSASFWVFAIPISVLTVGTLITMAMVLIWMVSRQCSLILYQWRPLFFTTHFFIAWSVVLASIYYFSRVWDYQNALVDPKCLATETINDTDLDCTYDYLNDYWFFCLWTSCFFTWVVIELLVLFWTRDVVRKWWIAFIFERVVLRKDDFRSFSETLHLEIQDAE